MMKSFCAAVLAAGLLVGASIAIPGQARAEVTIDLSAVLTANPEGGDALAAAIADLVTNSSDPVAATEAILAGLDSATPEQKAAVGKGLGMAASTLGLSHPEHAAKISDLVASAEPSVKDAYASTVSGGESSGEGAPGGTAPTTVVGVNGGTQSSGGTASPN